MKRIKTHNLLIAYFCKNQKNSGRNHAHTIFATPIFHFSIKKIKSVANWQSAFFAEALGTAILSFVIFSVTSPQNDDIPPKMAPLLIGGTVASLITVIAPLTQAGFNPARDFGPRLVTFLAGWGGEVAFKGWWVYILAPIFGAVFGGSLSKLVTGE